VACPALRADWNQEQADKKVTGDQSRTLRAGDRVYWSADKNDLGTVIEKNWAGVTIKWNNRSKQTILHNDMGQVERVTMKVM
jgi:hypothetical protein